MNKWEKVPFADIFSFYNGKAIKASKIGEYPIYGSNGIIGSSKNYLYCNAIILGRVGAYCGSVMYCRNAFWASDNTLVVDVNEERDDKLYCYYMLQTLRLNNFAGGSAQPLITQTILKKLVCPRPSLNQQQQIAKFLSSYDDLIENNRKQIKLLEEAAQRLYKEWFVDLRFPGHEETPIVDGVPAGWERKRADTFFEITIGKTPPRAEKQWFTSGDKGVPWLSISDMGNAGVYAFYTSEGLTEEAVKKHNMKIVPIGTIFVSFKLTVGRVAIANTDMCTNEAIAHFYIKDDIYRPYTYCYLRNFEYDTLGNTSSISKAVNSKIIKSMPFVMPDRDTISSFSEMVSPILDEINNKQKACLRLIESRDRLLPKLMSGEIEV